MPPAYARSTWIELTLACLLLLVAVATAVVTLQQIERGLAVLLPLSHGASVRALPPAQAPRPDLPARLAQRAAERAPAF